MPQQHTKTHLNFPDDGLGGHNHCRNPGQLPLTLGRNRARTLTRTLITPTPTPTATATATRTPTLTPTLQPSPGREERGPWCYTMDPSVRFELCALPPPQQAGCADRPSASRPEGVWEHYKVRGL